MYAIIPLLLLGLPLINGLVVALDFGGARGLELLLALTRASSRLALELLNDWYAENDLDFDLDDGMFVDSCCVFV